MNKEKLIDLSQQCREETNKVISRISEIIEEKLKSISKEFDVDPKDLILQITPINSNKTKYDVLIRIDAFTIETSFTHINY